MDGPSDDFGRASDLTGDFADRRRQFLGGRGHRLGVGERGVRRLAGRPRIPACARRGFGQPVGGVLHALGLTRYAPD